MASAKPTVAIIGTCDTKLAENVYVQEQIKQCGCDAVIIDVGCKSVDDPAIQIDQHGLLSLAGAPVPDVSELSRGEFVDLMIPAVTSYVKDLCDHDRVHGLITLGGSTGTSLGAAVMRSAVPVGFPKLLVSTMASGDTSTYVDNVDITMMYSVVDIAGLNFLSRAILANGASAVAAMAKTYASRKTHTSGSVAKKRRIGMTMFGVTTVACDAIRDMLTTEQNCEVVVFHATGAGGRALERLVAEGAFDGVVDITTTEIADEIVGGVLSAGPDRLQAAARAGVPQVVSVGACDMVNFGPADTVPQKWRDAGRNLYVHNPAVTLMRTNADECRQTGKFISDALVEHSANKSAIKVLLPLQGFSAISIAGGPFHDPHADAELRRALEDGLRDSGIEFRAMDQAINDRGFASAVVEALMEAMEQAG